MKRTKKLLAMALALVMCLSLCVPALACDNNEEPVVEALGEDTYFVHTTREEYIAAKADRQNISYEEAEAELEAKLSAAIAAIPSPAAWDGLSTTDNGDTTYTTYGWIYKIYTHSSGVQVKYGTYAVKLRSYQGSMWYDLDEIGFCDPYNSGTFTAGGSVRATLESPQKVVVVMTGYFDISRDVAIEYGFDLEILSVGSSSSATDHYRCSISDSFVERAN